MTHDTNSEIVRRVFEEGLNRRDPAVFDELVADDYVNHESANIAVHTTGPQNWSDVVARLGASFPNVSWRVLRTLSRDDQVWAEVVMSGTHEGALFAIPATGRSFEVRQVHLHRVEGGLIREHWAVRDDLGILVQLGLVESPTPAQQVAAR